MIALLAAPSAALVMIPEIKNLPAPHPYAISSDGGTVVGGFSPANGFRYEVSSGRLTRLSPGGRAVYPNAVSDRGGQIAGVAKNAFVLAGKGYRTLPPLPGDSASVASGISSDGAAIVGYSQSEKGTFRAVRWRAGRTGVLGRVTGYPDMHARSVARGGAVVVGAAYNPSKAVRAFLWTEMLGARLLPLPSWANESSAEVITPDGRYAVGSVSARSRTTGARWALGFGKVLALPNLSGAPTGGALAVDPGGKFVAGFSGEKAVIWDSAGRVFTVQSFLSSRGASVGGWSFEQVVGIGRRGRRVILTGWGARNGKGAGFVAAFSD